jgi:hypothetical protein
MKTSEKLMLWITGILFVIAVLLLAVKLVSAEDNDVGICTEPGAVNYPGVEVIDSLKEAGLRPVNDGSCYYLQCDPAVPDEPELGAYSCDMGTKDHNNFDDWVNDRLPGMLYGPAYYGKLIDTGGCTDPLAYNYMNPIYWPDYNIIENGSCEFLVAVPELPEGE